MHPDFKAILGYLREFSIKLTITSNGHSVASLEDNELRAFHDIEFSLDYPTQAEQDAQRGPGNWELIHQQAERCVRLGVPVTIIAVMMKSNYLRLADVAQVAKRFAAPLRVNVYQAVRSDLYALTYERILARVPQAVREHRCNHHRRTAGEGHGRPAAAGRGLRGQHGARDARATTQPCVLWPGLGEPFVRVDFFRGRDFELCAV